MNLMGNTLVAVIAAASLVSPSPAGTADAAGNEVPALAQVEAARTPADHADIAQAYDREAAALDARAESHSAMARMYRAGGTPKANSRAMISHCERLAMQYRDVAKTARALAAEHRAMAGESGK